MYIGLLGDISKHGNVNTQGLTYLSDQDNSRIHIWHDEAANVWSGDKGLLVLDGFIWDAPGIPIDAPAGALWEKLKNEGTEYLAKVNGDFSLFYWNSETQESVWAIDKIGVGKCYYLSTDTYVVFGSKLRSVASLASVERSLNQYAVLKYLMFNYNPGVDTFFKDIQRLRPGYVLTRSASKVSASCYWRLNFAPDSSISEEQAAEGIRTELSKAVKRRMTHLRRPGAFLSGGLDSSSVVSLLHSHGAEDQATFSFRCKGESFDESPYAKKVADAFSTDHHLVEYGPEETGLAREMVQYMDEPFCDVGINIGTFLLAKTALGNADALFTGDGGDELFAGHPVYTADNMAKHTDRLPGFLFWPLKGLAAIISDSDKKKDWRVKVKRFVESSAYPAALGTHRWRVYYTAKTLSALMNESWLKDVDQDVLLSDLLLYNREGEGADSLSRSLYSDYQTAVQFYLRRMDMARGLDLSPRFPMLDPDLSAYCATLPSDLKIKGMSDTKYIERIAVEPLLPHDVVYRKDKLGHSIPLKNWMRDNASVISLMQDLLLGGSLAGRGWFNMNRIENMIKEHANRRTNHSHRLWSLMILELWLQHHFDVKEL